MGKKFSISNYSSGYRIRENPLLLSTLESVRHRMFLNHLRCKSIFLFATEKISSAIPHFFVCVAQQSSQNQHGVFTFVVCTTKYEKRKWKIETNNLPYETLVWIKPDTVNELRKDSFIDCNGYQQFSYDELRLKYQNGALQYIGEIKDSYFEQILIGLEKSPRVVDATKLIVRKVKQTLFA